MKSEDSVTFNIHLYLYCIFTCHPQVISLLLLAFFPFAEVVQLLQERTFDELLSTGRVTRRGGGAMNRSTNARADGSTNTSTNSTNETVAKVAVKFLMRGVDRLWLRLPTWEVQGRRYLAACQRYNA
jgi:hypothetical protein